MWKVAGRPGNPPLIFLVGLPSIFEAALVEDEISLPLVAAFLHYSALKFATTMSP